jgi:hypothetical protein
LKKLSLPLIILIIISAGATAQRKNAAQVPKKPRCLTMEYMAAAIQKDPTLPEKWKKEGEKRYQAYLQRAAAGRAETPTAAPIEIPVVFHLVDSAQRLSGITDRDIFGQVFKRLDEEVCRVNYNFLLTDCFN